MMRKEIRSKNLVPNSFSSAELVPIDGVTLDHGLTNIKYNAAENYCNHKENYFNTMSFLCEREDYSKIENKKRLAYVTKLTKIIDEMPDNDLSNGFRKDCGKGDRLKHSELVTLYYVVKESLAMQNTLSSDGEITIYSDD